MAAHEPESGRRAAGARGLRHRALRRTGTAARCAVATAALITLVACTSPRGAATATPTEEPTVPSAATSDGGASDGDAPVPSSALAIPTVELVTAPPASVPDAQGRPSMPTDTLVTLLSEKLSGSSTTTVQTVGCAEPLVLERGASTQCTATLRDAARASQQVWHVYPTHNPDGSTALLFLSGDPLSSEFAEILGSTGTAVVSGSVGPTFGSGDLDEQEVTDDAQAVLEASGSSTVLGSCEGTLSFATFDPVSCATAGDGVQGRVYVLPGTFVSADPGLLVVTVRG